MKIKKCLRCNSRTFYIKEIIVHEADLADHLELIAYKVHKHRIKKIYCSKCGEEYSECNFKDILFP